MAAYGHVASGRLIHLDPEVQWKLKKTNSCRLHQTQLFSRLTRRLREIWGTKWRGSDKVSHMDKWMSRRREAVIDAAPRRGEGGREDTEGVTERRKSPYLLRSRGGMKANIWFSVTVYGNGTHSLCHLQPSADWCAWHISTRTEATSLWV